MCKQNLKRVDIIGNKSMFYIKPKWPALNPTAQKKINSISYLLSVSVKLIQVWFVELFDLVLSCAS